MSAHEGSSPLARGPLTIRRHTIHTRRLIPARAGTTAPVAPAVNHDGAHPRSRGDHPVLIIMVPKLLGSSPLARGPLDDRRNLSYWLGLIPARAGTTQHVRPSKWRSRAHPRSRGDHADALARRLPHLGSSPLARGPLHYGGRDFEVPGLIPARAGTT